MVAPADPLVDHGLEHDLRALAPLLAHPGADDVDRRVEGVGIASGSDLSQRLQPQLGVLVALHRGDQEAPAQFAVAIEVQHRAGAPPAGSLHARTGERRPDVLLAIVEVLDGDPPKLALEDLGAALGLGADR